ncbi:MAG: helix-turn-helix domain-containing protein [Clostridiaceae bacterium]|nr:helix-turn-helix domain-containing protein [Clostridiaceae bacterium]
MSVPTIVDLLHEGKIPYRRAGQRWLIISKAALDDWLSNTGNKN